MGRNTTYYIFLLDILQSMLKIQNPPIPRITISGWEAGTRSWIARWLDEPRFKVNKGLYDNHLIEEWQMEGYKAKAWRGWDSTADRWIFTWVSELGHYQVWEEGKVGGHWYMFKIFTINGEEVLSRQAFIPLSNGTVVRTSEHSRDGGERWTLRFKEIYTKVENNNE